MAIDWYLEVIKPYNEDQGTNFKDAGELIAFLRYEGNLTWLAIDKKLGVSASVVRKKLRNSTSFNPVAEGRKKSLRRKILDIPKEKLKSMKIMDIKKELGLNSDAYYYRSSIYTILRKEKLIYKKIKKEK